MRQFRSARLFLEGEQTLHTDPLRVRLGTMVSFQSNGSLFDTRGVRPDVHVEPTPGFFIGDEDDQLRAAVRIIEGAQER